MSLLLYEHQKKDAFSLSLSLRSHQGSLLSLPNFVTYPVCFLTAYKMMSCPSFLAQVLDSRPTLLRHLLLPLKFIYVGRPIFKTELGLFLKNDCSSIFYGGF